MFEKLRLFGKFPTAYFEIVIGALALSIVAVVLSSRVNSLAFDVQPTIGDNAGQYVTSTVKYLDYLYTGRLTTIWDTYLNDRRPLWSIVPLLIDPKLLIDLNGHIVTGGIFLFSFLSVMGISIYKHTRLPSYAIASMMAVLAAGNFFHYLFGMGGNYTDLQTAWLIGAALFSLINSEEGQRGRWLVSFGVFSALAQQVRFVSIGVTAVVCAPILGYYLLRRWQNGRMVKSVFIPLMQVLIPFLVISGYSLITKTTSYVYYYVMSPMVTSGVMHLYKPIAPAVELYLRVYDYHLGKVGIGILLFFCIVYFLLNWQYRDRNGSLMVSLWALSAFLLTHIFILRITGEWVYTVYMLPGFYLFAFLPFDLDLKRNSGVVSKDKIRNIVSLAGIIVLPIIMCINFREVSKKVVVVDEFASKIATYQKDMSAILTQLTQEYYSEIQTRQDIPTFETFVEISAYPSGQPVAIDVWYRYQQPIEWVNLSLVWKATYQMAYPNMPLQEIQAAVYERVVDNVDLVIVLSDPRNEKVIRLSEMYPQQEGDEWNLNIHEYIYKRVKEDQLNWRNEPISSDGVYHSPFGDILVFRNLKRYELRNSR